ncbi:Ig-like domain-containing protein, partial [Longimicrobium sp.]|uniref:Ig-like domain-containing protein n=1 Tax=Longimicrobium sp. TaxID=2029185 RepID=UPI002F936069
MRFPALIVLCTLLTASACKEFTGSDEPRVASVAMSQDSLVVAVGASAQVSASPQDGAGQAVAGVAVAWTSSDTLVATVSQSGLVAGRAQGQATITAKAGSRRGTTRVRVAYQPTLRIVSGTGGTDTVQHRREPLVVEVRDSVGAPARGVAVWFAAMMLSPAPGCAALQPTGCHSSPGVVLGSNEWVSAVVETDMQGRAAVPVRMGTVAGPTEVEISVYKFGLSQIAPFTAAPGAPARIVRAPADTALYVGASFVPRTTTLDRWGNVPSVAVAVTFSPADAGVAVAGDAVSAVAIGRSKVVVRAGAAA